MALVFQYGSNLSTGRLNDESRLNGDARLIGKAITQDEYEFAFDIWSKAVDGRAASDIVGGRGHKIWGVIYDIPDYLIYRETAKAKSRKSLDSIEGEGVNYQRTSIKLQWPNGFSINDTVLTYIGIEKARKAGIKTNWDYVQHILIGIDEHGMPLEYRRYVIERILANNPELSEAIRKYGDQLRTSNPSL